MVLSVRPQLLGAMIPRLIKPPIHSSGLRALGALAEVAGGVSWPLVAPRCMLLLEVER